VYIVWFGLDATYLHKSSPIKLTNQPEVVHKTQMLSLAKESNQLKSPRSIKGINEVCIVCSPQGLPSLVLLATKEVDRNKISLVMVAALVS